MYGMGSFHHRLGWFFSKLPFNIYYVLGRELTSGDAVLDMGCGPNSPLRLCKVKHKVGMDIFAPYIEKARQQRTHDEFIVADIKEVQFEPGSFDAVVAIDVLEHLPKEDGLRLIERMKSWARKKIIITVPNGYTPGHVQDNNPFQEHLSAYSTAELRALGFRVHGIGVKRMPGYVSRGFMFYLSRYGSYPARLVTFYFPNLAFDLLGVFEHPKGERI